MLQYVKQLYSVMGIVFYCILYCTPALFLPYLVSQIILYRMQYQESSEWHSSCLWQA